MHKAFDIEIITLKLQTFLVALQITFFEPKCLRNLVFPKSGQVEYEILFHLDSDR